MSPEDQQTLVEVRLVDFPVRLYRRAAEHNDELLREFALVEDLHRETGGVPGRLADLMRQLQQRFSVFTAQPRAALEEAQANDVQEIDLTYRVPPAAREAVITLGQLLDEADEFCRSGEDLLTLATPPDAVAFRRWFLSEFLRQIDGAPPTPWPAWRP